jgi:hypothetical protein
VTEKVWTFPGQVPRDKWGPGPWDDEPDKVEWRDRDTRMPCIARRHEMGHWCGYVAVPREHPWYLSDDAPVNVHGGQTFGSLCDPREDERSVCHVPMPGEPDDVWWIGFDCAHAGDVQPGMDAIFREIGRATPLMGLAGRPSQYRTLGYVFEECHRLAAQAAAAALPPDHPGVRVPPYAVPAQVDAETAPDGQGPP